jgi:hypothetical protein
MAAIAQCAKSPITTTPASRGRILDVPVEGGTGRAVGSPAASTLREEMAVSGQRLLAASGQIPMAAHTQVLGFSTSNLGLSPCASRGPTRTTRAAQPHWPAGPQPTHTRVRRARFSRWPEREYRNRGSGPSLPIRTHAMRAAPVLLFRAKQPGVGEPRGHGPLVAAYSTDRVVAGQDTDRASGTYSLMRTPPGSLGGRAGTGKTTTVSSPLACRVAGFKPLRGRLRLLRGLGSAAVWPGGGRSRGGGPMAIR